MQLEHPQLYSLLGVVWDVCAVGGDCLDSLASFNVLLAEFSKNLKMKIL